MPLTLYSRTPAQAHCAKVQYSLDTNVSTLFYNQCLNLCMVSLLDLCTCAQKWAPAPCVHTGFLLVLGQYTVLYLPLSSCFIEWTQHHFVPLLRHWFPVWAAPKTWQLAPLPTHTQLIRQYFCGPCITPYTFVGGQLCLRTPSQNPVFFRIPYKLGISTFL